MVELRWLVVFFFFSIQQQNPLVAADPLDRANAHLPLGLFSLWGGPTLYLLCVDPL